MTPRRLERRAGLVLALFLLAVGPPVHGDGIQIDARPVEYLRLDDTPRSVEVLTPTPVEYLFIDRTSIVVGVQATPVEYVPTTPLPWSLARTHVSAPISYLVAESVLGPSVSIRGSVVDTTGTPVAGAHVLATPGQLPMAVAWSDANGAFQLPPIPGGMYAIKASLEGYTTAGLVAEFRTGQPALRLVLAKLPQPPQTVAVATPVPPSLTPFSGLTTTGRLKGFVNGAWQADAPIKSDRITMVLTHGWIFCDDNSGGIGGWPTVLASQLVAAGIDERANILAWDWAGDARNCLRGRDGAVGPPVDRTQPQGLALGRALQNSLGVDYAMPIHFMGHSLGALVQATAANYLHGDGATEQVRSPNPWDPQRTHVTLFDEAELAVIAGNRALTGASVGFAVGREASLGSVPIALATAAFGFVQGTIHDWRNPIPSQVAWVDNYVSTVGMVHPNAVNVCLQIDSTFAMLDGGFAKAHGVPMDWYAATIGRPGLSVMGFTNSFVSRGRMPPGTPGTFVGEVYVQASAADRHLLRPGADDDYTQLWQEVGKFVARETTTAVVDRVEDVIRTGGQVAARTGSWLQDRVDSLDVLQRVETAIDLAGRPGLVLGLSSAPRPSGGRGATPSGDSDASIGQPAYAWLRVAVPSDAAFLQFDFTLTGNGADDEIVLGVNGTNHFNLDTKFVPPGVRTSSSRINVASAAGTEAEIFLGLMGGTSTKCTLTIEGLRFVALAEPSLQIWWSGGQDLVLSWPESGLGYHVEFAESLTQTIWTRSTVPVTRESGLLRVTHRAVDTARFFRLSRD